MSESQLSSPLVHPESDAQTEEHPTGRALVVTDEGRSQAVRDLDGADLGSGEVTIRIEWSGVNYKDALAATEGGRVARLKTLVPGIDLAGTVIAVTGAARQVAVGEKVIVHGYDLGVAHHGGFAEYARVPADWVVPLPAGLTTREAMAIGTAGYTAALSVIKLRERGLLKHGEPILVTGASGGVGGIAVRILLGLGHHVFASTGKPEARDRLLGLGCAEVLGRLHVPWPSKPMQREQWSAVIDSVGGRTLSSVLGAVAYSGGVAASGNTSGTALETTVFPFILRGVQLIGIDSVNTPMDLRRAVWNQLADQLRPYGLEDVATREVGLEQLPDVFTRMLAGGADGRTLVNPRLSASPGFGG